MLHTSQLQLPGLDRHRDEARCTCATCATAQCATPTCRPNLLLPETQLHHSPHAAAPARSLAQRRSTAVPVPGAVPLYRCHKYRPPCQRRCMCVAQRYFWHPPEGRRRRDVGTAFRVGIQSQRRKQGLPTWTAVTGSCVATRLCTRRSLVRSHELKVRASISVGHWWM